MEGLRKERNLKSWEFEKSSYALVKVFVSHQWWKEKLESLNIETLLLIIKGVGKKDPLRAFVVARLATSTTSALSQSLF